MTVTSANTSINHVPALIRNFHDQLGSSNLDWGGGKYDTATSYMCNMGKSNFVYDPHNRTALQNEFALKQPITSITCINVLNVIKEDLDLTKCLFEIYNHSMSQGGVPVFFSIYPGNSSLKGKVTKKDCYQRNRPVALYRTAITTVFPPTQWKWERLNATCFYLRKYIS